MERSTTERLSVDAAEVAGRLAALAEAAPDGILAFDGDGTLWSGDVGEDLFHYFVSRSLLREEAAEALAREAAAHGIPAHGTPSEIAFRLFQAYLATRYGERDVCAMMTWCYAGYTLDELDGHTERALAETRLADRLHHELEPIFARAREAGLRTVIVSASPAPVVERAARLWQFAPRDVIASRAALDGARILPRLSSPVPYAEHKPEALAAVAGGRPLLASFGDNVFDIELLRAAKLGVAVRPKPALRMRLPELPDVLLLAPHARG